jgi:cytochrome c
MHFSLLEKLGAAVLICAWIIFGANALGNMLVRVEPLAHPAIAVATAEKAAPAAAAPEPQVDFKTLLAQATPAAGEKVFNKCKACHSIEEGGPIKVGPDLWGVVDRPMANVKGFSYSDGLVAMGAKGDKWTYDALNEWLTSPKDFVKGTKMTFAGLKSAEDRANVIAYLRSQSTNPPPLP